MAVILSGAKRSRRTRFFVLSFFTCSGQSIQIAPQPAHAIRRLQRDLVKRAIVLEIRHVVDQPIPVPHLRLDCLQIRPDRRLRLIDQKHAPARLRYKLSQGPWSRRDMILGRQRKKCVDLGIAALAGTRRLIH
jgi:hypothetical protein